VHRAIRDLLAAGLCALLAGCMTLSTDQQVAYGLNHYSMGLYNQAIPPLVSAASSLEGRNPPDPRLSDVLVALGNMAQATGREDLAENYLPRAVKAAEAIAPPDPTRLRNSLVHLGSFYTGKKPSEAVPLLERAERISATLNDPVLNAIDIDNLAGAHRALKDYAHAISLGQRALQVIEQHPGAKLAGRTKGTILSNLGESYAGARDQQRAESCFKQSLEVLRAAPSEVEAWRLKEAVRRYSDFLRSVGREKEAGSVGASAA
jgi:tetratricopeptide (TPR) repeat protein